MARTRTIKPGFFRNELLAECNPLARLLFSGIWTLADREGRVEDRPTRIKADCLAYDRCDIEKLLTQLSDRGFIVRYVANGRGYIQVVNWSKHQQPHYKEVASEIPPPTGHQDSGYVAFGVSESKRQEIFNRDSRQCVKCGSTDDLTLDHIIARANGGTDDDDNLRTLCNQCNASKGRRDDDPTSGQRRVNVDSIKVLDDTLDARDVTLTLNLDTVNSDSLVPLVVPQEKPEPPKPVTTLKPRTEKQLTADAVYEHKMVIVSSYFRGLGVEEGTLPWNQRKGQSLGALTATILNSPECVPEIIEPLTRYTKAAFAWRDGKKTPQLSEVLSAFAEWDSDGRPEHPPPKQFNGRASPSSGPVVNGRVGMTHAQLVAIGQEEST